MRLRKLQPFCVFCLITILAVPAPAEVITLKNGMRLEGSVDRLGSLGADALKGKAVGEVATKEIVIVDDDLRRIFVGQKQVQTVGDSQLSGFERIKLQQPVAAAGPSIASVGPIVRVQPFDKYGRRIFTMTGNKGNIDVIQGITEITPTYTKVEALTTSRFQYVWTMRIATSSIPRETLSEILMHRIDRKNPEQRLSIVRLYVQGQRIQDARAELESLIEDFPNLADLQDQVKSLRQIGATTLIKEIELRREAGQHLLAINMLTNFPTDGIAGETVLKARDTLAEYEAVKAKGERILQLMVEHHGKIENADSKKRAQVICEEIAQEMNIHSFDRMADYLRLENDPKLSAEQKLSLAISGWLLGSGNGIDNLAVSLSLVQVREQVRKYLVSKNQPERDAALQALQSLEGSTPEYLAKIIAHMKPPMATFARAPEAAEGKPSEVPVAAEPVAKPAEKPADAAVDPPAAAPRNVPAPPPLLQKPAAGGLLDKNLPAMAPVVKPKQPEGKEVATDRGVSPAGVQSPHGGIAGLLKLQTTGIEEDPFITYYVQLPPEYDPYRRYPCIVTLNGAGTTPIQQVDWWAGPHNAKAGTRYGQATRHGYIVIAPVWTREHQRDYEFTIREHAAVLRTLRDACRRFSIDTDQVFLSGHSMGGDAAWDIGLAHPDLWAGVIPIVARSEKYIPRYSENGRNLPMYFVCGEKDGDKWPANATDWERYLKFVGYDSMVVQFQGRGHEHFHDEIQNLFEWMNLHRRDFFPKKFAANSLRPWDKYFWFVELDAIPEVSMVPPQKWPPPSGTLAAKVEASILPTNGVSVDSSSTKATVWLSPEIVNFTTKPFVTFRGKREMKIQPDVSVLLEDVRTRSDRQHPFWAKVRF